MGKPGRVISGRAAVLAAMCFTAGNPAAPPRALAILFLLTSPGPCSATATPPTAGRHLPQSLLGIAMDYALGQWPTLDVYLNNGRVEIDNNLVENAIRPTALGKKNWLFVGEADAGERGAIIYTLIESCRRRGIDPYAYLKDVLTRLPKMTNHQVPEVWAKAHPQAQRKLAS